MAGEMATAMARPAAMLFGRRTWEDLSNVWAHADDGNPFSTHMNAVTKCVVSTTLADADAWQNSVVLRGEAAETIAELRGWPGDDLSIIGSASLVNALHTAALVDHYTLLVRPVTLGSGTRIFEEPAPPTELDLTGSIVATKGVIVAHYTRR